MHARMWVVAAICFAVATGAAAQSAEPGLAAPSGTGESLSTPPPTNQAPPGPSKASEPAAPAPPAPSSPVPTPSPETLPPTSTPEGTSSAPSEGLSPAEQPSPTPEAALPATEPAPAAPTEPSPPKFESVVVGTSEAKTSGSVHIVKSSKLQRYEQDDPHAILQSVPGVYTRGEDGFGLRPNVGLRGVNPDRSKKVTLLEDGVLFGPAPYSAPAAYYFPLMTRMQSVRILKGPAAIQHGPQTVGGSVELITRDIPAEEDFGVDVGTGQDLYGKLHGHYGASTERSGFLVEGLHLRSNGFKELDGDGHTGFRRNEWMLKARHRLDVGGPSRHSLQLKLGYSDEVSNESYLGLSDEDFQANPVRRYAVSRLDRMENHRTQVVLSHQFESGTLAVTTQAYRHDYHRTWRKVNRFQGIDIASVLADPTSARNAIYYGVLTGQLDSTTSGETLLIGPNNRAFVSQGLQSVARWTTTTGPLSHNVEAGARYHFDSIKRHHTEDGFRMVAGELVPEGGPTATTANNRDSTHAVALHLTDAVTWGRLVVTPGVRLELLRSQSVNHLSGTRQDGALEVILPGLGVYGSLTRALGLFAGVYRGFSPPAPGQPEAVLPEKSVNFEGGARWTRSGERFEVVGFLNAYSNLTDVCTFSNGCLNENLDRQVDAGAARIVGLEAFAEKTFRPGGGVTFPASLSYTFTQTRLLEDFRSEDPQYGLVRAGDEMPYVPRHQLFASAGVESARGGLHLSASFVDSMREEAGQGEVEPGKKTGALLTFDLNASWSFAKEAEVYLSARNLLNEQVIVSRRPYGARPNAPRTVLIGLKYSL
ncbi:TonB-dependent receptor family protein [Hyalangium sp.]|uniref:TonB-dependent receptor family protein n=1 Tax=Hyalangium sp. TaxID=2028555 RepID=UPI002D5DEABD|nr:TonB-dependent receptor [Hyalangium sp.]HYH98488.1 TonB-dependent receptor [Hyalangium sp.]